MTLCACNYKDDYGYRKKVMWVVQKEGTERVRSMESKDGQTSATVGSLKQSNGSTSEAIAACIKVPEDWLCSTVAGMHLMLCLVNSFVTIRK